MMKDILSLLVSLIILQAPPYHKGVSLILRRLCSPSQQNQVDDIVEQAHGGRQAVLGALNLAKQSGDDADTAVLLSVCMSSTFSKESSCAAPGPISMMTMVGIIQIDVDTLQPCKSMVAASCRSTKRPPARR
ncbi:MAG: hypothetical protein ACLSBB_11435 [Ruthenibacterium lactatiformans]